MPEKKELPLEIKEASPHKPDISWAVRIISILGGLLLAGYVAYEIFLFGLFHYLTIEKEHELFGFIGATSFSGASIFDPANLSYTLPESYQFPMYIVDESDENAFAMIGGNLMITQGLLDSAENEEELLFILGHEITHLRNQDALKGLINAAPFAVLSSYLGGESDITIGQLTQAYQSYTSRKTEHQADEGGVALLLELGLNTKCAVGFFQRNMLPGEEYGEFFSSHPINQKRIEYIASQAGEFADKECTPLPESSQEEISEEQKFLTMEEVYNNLPEQGIEIYFKDFGDSIITFKGYHIYRCISPQLTPITFGKDTIVINKSLNIKKSIKTHPYI